MKRRRFIELSSLAVTGLAGCSSTAESPGSTSSSDSTVPRMDETETTASGRTDTLSDSTTASPGASLSVELDSLQPGVVTQRSADSIGVESGDDTQYLYLDVAVEWGTAPAREDLRMRFDGREFAPSNRDRGLWRAYTHGNSRYDAENGGGWLLFELPETGDASNVALVKADGPGEWPIITLQSMNLDGRLESRWPPLSLEWSVPDTVEPGTKPTQSFTVTNEGDSDGTFVGALNRSGSSIAMAPIAAITKVIPPGEPTTFEVTDDRNVESPGDENMGDGDPDMRYDLHWTGQSRSQQIRVVESSN